MTRSRFHPEMVFLANLGVNLHGCLFGCAGTRRSPRRKLLISLILAELDFPRSGGTEHVQRVKKPGLALQGWD
ncbi:hypothetical protein TRIP_B200693 [uncultured Desulfatiglans sp.]|nr:hypothetical protein TRIP_B200693 [uncultured Desulfatiglans sp.]